MAPPIPVCLTIAGSDSSAGAGLQADLKTFSALDVYGVTAATCVVAEVPGKVSRIDAVPPENVRTQFELLLASFPVAAAKTGLLCSAEIVTLVAEIFVSRAGKIPLVVDPVMIATSGDPLLQPAAIEIYERRLFPLAMLLTPNLAEATALTGLTIRNGEEMRAAGKELQQKYRTSVLLKGGHLAGDRAVDLLFEGDEIIEFSAHFIPGIATHGTGCTYSAAIVAEIAKGSSLSEAIGRAKEFVTRAIAEHFSWPSSLGAIDALNHRIR